MSPTEGRRPPRYLEVGDRIWPALRRVAGLHTFLYRRTGGRLGGRIPGLSGKVLLLDRGTIDGSGYWPDGPYAYWRELGTSAEAELARYDAVVWMQTSAALPDHAAYDASSNRRRFEDAAAAVASGALMRDLWRAHPRLIEVPAFPTIEEKIGAVRRALDAV